MNIFPRLAAARAEISRLNSELSAARASHDKETERFRATARAMLADRDCSIQAHDQIRLAYNQLKASTPRSDTLRVKRLEKELEVAKGTCRAREDSAELIDLREHLQRRIDNQAEIDNLRQQFSRLQVTMRQLNSRLRQCREFIRGLGENALNDFDALRLVEEPTAPAPAAKNHEQHKKSGKPTRKTKKTR